LNNAWSLWEVFVCPSSQIVVSVEVFVFAMEGHLDDDNDLEDTSTVAEDVLDGAVGLGLPHNVDLEAGVEFDDASFGPGCASTSRVFSSGTTQLLENLYASGMNGWGSAHTGDIEMAISATSLKLSQIKVI